MSALYNLIKYFLFLLPSELTHGLGILALQGLGFLHRLGVYPKPTWASHPKLLTKTPFGEITSPLGLAAGCDKNAEALWGWQALGFGFVEVGTVTPEPQSGNPHPRVFRYVRHRAVINRLGFNNDGAKKIAKRIAHAKKQGLKIKVGGNIGKNKNTPIELTHHDYHKAASILAPYVDYLVINVSSPNTEGLRNLQGQEALEEIVKTVRASCPDKPLFIKVAPDRYQQFIDGVIAVISKHKLSGVICGNTLVNHAAAEGIEVRDITALPDGGMSGLPILGKNISLVEAYKKKDNSVYIIGVGGIQNAEHATRYFRSGAKLIQVYTGLIFEGPKLVKNLLEGIK